MDYSKENDKVGRRDGRNKNTWTEDDDFACQMDAELDGLW